MPENEKDRFLEDASSDDDDKDFERVISKKKVAISCCFCCLILAITFLSIRLILHLFHIHPSPKNSSPSKVVFPKNLSEFMFQNQQLCEKVRGKDATKIGTTINSPLNIYIVKTKYNLTEKQACSIESILRLFPDKTIYLIDFDKVAKVDLDRSEYRPTYLQLLLYLYKDRLQLVLADKVEFFKDTPFHNISRDEETFDFLAMLVTAYKYGGFAATPDVVMTSRELIECFPEDTIIEPFAVMTSRNCDESLYYLMESFVLCYSHSSVSLENMLTKSAELYSSSLDPGTRRLRKMLPHEVCSNTKRTCHFYKLGDFNARGSKWISEISPFCKQIAQACLGLKLNKLQVDEETSKMKTSILENGNISCDHSNRGYTVCW